MGPSCPVIEPGCQADVRSQSSAGGRDGGRVTLGLYNGIKLVLILNLKRQRLVTLPLLTIIKQPY